MDGQRVYTYLYVWHPKHKGVIMLISEIFSISAGLDRLGDLSEDKDAGYLCHVLAMRLKDVAGKLSDEADRRSFAAGAVTAGDAGCCRERLRKPDAL